MSLLDTLTGGADSNAQSAEQTALENFATLQNPTAQQLTIPQLQQYVVAGLMTPAQAQAYLVNNNAYNNIQLSPEAMAAEEQALAQTQNIANTGGNDAEAKLAMQQAQDAATSTLAGEEGANVLQAEQRGVAPGLAAEAENEADIGNNANALFGSDQQAAAAAEARQLQAIQNASTQAGNIENQEYTQAANQAAAQNAIEQFNAQNQTNVSQSNAANTQAANAYNAENAQNVSNANTQENAASEIYNATQAPQTAYQDALQKAEGESGAANNLANQQMAQGSQAAGLIGSILGGAAQIGAAAATPAPAAPAQGAWDGGEIDYTKGGRVPGKAPLPGDHPANDIMPAHVGKQPIKLSPGEVVVPRSLAQHPDPLKITQFLRSLPRTNPTLPKPHQVHPHDIAKVLSALSTLRGGQQ